MPGFSPRHCHKTKVSISRPRILTRRAGIQTFPRHSRVCVDGAGIQRYQLMGRRFGAYWSARSIDAFYLIPAAESTNGHLLRANAPLSTNARFGINCCALCAGILMGGIAKIKIGCVKKLLSLTAICRAKWAVVKPERL